jgi:serine/threonine protein kinase
VTEGEGRLIVGRYRLRESLGRGGMGVVWLARDEFLHRDVAIKEIRLRDREIRDTDPEVARALREARAAAKLSEHPGIVTVHDVVTDERGLPWIVMRLLQGRSLATALAVDGPMSVDKAAAVGVQVLQALDYAHNAGVMHRDVKPGNVMLVGDQVVLTDFGIALIDGASVLTATGQLPGVPEYIAPERILGEEALAPADLWSVGIMLYGMVVGRTPFQRADVQATLGAALTREPDPDPAVGKLGPVIAGLLKKKPAERMRAAQAIEALTRIAALPAPAAAERAAVTDTGTLRDSPGSETTVVDATIPHTLLAPPPFQPARPVHDAPTLDPRPPGPPSRNLRLPLAVAAAVVAVIALVVTIVLVNQSDDEGGDPGAAGQETDTAAPHTTLKTYREQLGFEIAVPPDWQREASTDEAVGDVIWEGEQTDPTIGALKVQVRRDGTADGADAATYLADLDRAQRERDDRTEYDRIALSGDDSAADLEYTYRDGPTYFHLRTRAIAAGEVYTLTFSLFASDPTTLQDEWQASRALLTEIANSFRLTS